MKMRPVQLVCLALLLATLRLADPTALAPSDFVLRVGVLKVLLGTELTEARVETRALVARRLAVPASRAVQPLDAAATALLQRRWTMAPPAVQSVGVQSFTSFVRG